MKVGGLVVLALCACGDVKDPNKLPDAPVQQDGAVDGPDIDAPDIDAPPPRCDPQKPFGTPVAIAELNSTANDTAPALTPDELTITFGSTRGGGPGLTDAYIATRTSTTAAWGAPSLINGVNTAGNDGRPVMSGDQLTIYFEYEVSSTADWNIVSATRASTSSAFGAPSPVTALNTANNDTAPYVLPDQSAMYLLNNQVLTRAVRTGTTWGTPTMVTGTNLQTGGFDYPIATPDELTIYFASGRSGTMGAADIWRAHRTSVVNGFDAPVNVAALNSTTGDLPGWVSPDDCVIYFAHDVGAAAANYNIYRAERPL